MGADAAPDERDVMRHERLLVRRPFSPAFRTERVIRPRFARWLLQRKIAIVIGIEW